MKRSDAQPARATKVWVGWALVALVFAVMGSIFLVKGASLEPPEGAPVPQQPFSVDVEQPSKASSNASTSVGETPTPHEELPVSLKLKPNHLYIPSLRVEAPVIPENAPNGELVIPEASAVGIFEDGPGLYDSSGTTIIAGHVSMDGERGALYSLATIQPNALIVVTDGEGAPTYWEAVTLKSVPKLALASKVSGPSNPFPQSGAHRLALVTCGGKIVYEEGYGYSYVDNVIVMAAPRP